ncbi:MAG: hypothetical protein H6553_10130 [Chitinophagales bacterium]|nr:hypothetical protein [Chitinophagales bacterium]
MKALIKYLSLALIFVLMLGTACTRERDCVCRSNGGNGEVLFVKKVETLLKGGADNTCQSIDDQQVRHNEAAGLSENEGVRCKIE